MSSFIESELKSRLFDNQLSKTQDDDLLLFSFYSLLFINFYVKDKISFISLLFLKRLKKKTNYDCKSVNWWVHIVKIINNFSLYEKNSKKKYLLSECLCWRHLKILLTLWKLQKTKSISQTAHIHLKIVNVKKYNRYSSTHKKEWVSCSVSSGCKNHHTGLIG